MRQAVLLCALAAASPALLWAAGGDPPGSGAKAAGLSDAEKEHFLLEARIVRVKAASAGVTNSLRASLDLDGLEHDAHIQTIDEAKPVAALAGGGELDFRDSYRNNVAAYRLDRLLGLRMVPVTVVRHYERRKAAFTWWVDDVLMSEKDRYQKKVRAPDVNRWNCQIYVVRVFDELIYNVDRNLGNLLIDGDWRIWMIDHTRAFKIFKQVRNPKQLGSRCERHLLATLRRLDEPTLRTSMEDLLNSGQIEALLARRDQIVTYYEARMAELGEEGVLYDLPPRLVVAPEPR